MRAMQSANTVHTYLSDCRRLTLDEIARHFPRDHRYTAGLYDLMLDYPLRPAKALRPALCIAACLALGGELERTLPTAAALELFHNAFLIHDDVEDATEQRRHAPTLHVRHGVPIAVNVGDGLLATALEPLLFNTRVLGVGAALRVLQLFARMARESAEGQMLELALLRAQRWPIETRDYLRIVHKKTGWYSFIAPLQAGAIAARAGQDTIDQLGRCALLLGVAFQIQDDLLSLERDADDTGKDTLGDLWEGKYTLPLLHALATARASERAHIIALLTRARACTSTPVERASAESRAALRRKIEENIELSEDERVLVRETLCIGQKVRDAAAVAELAAFIRGRGGASLSYARRISQVHAVRAQTSLRGALAGSRPSEHTQFLEELVDFIVGRRH